MNEALGRKAINQFDVRCLRKVENIDAKDVFFHKPKFSSPQFSQAFTDWLVENIKADDGFLSRTRAEYSSRTKASGK